MDNFKKILRDVGLGHAELSLMLGKNPQYISQIVRGLRSPSPAEAVRIINIIRERGADISFADVRPDLPELEAQHG